MNISTVVRLTEEAPGITRASHQVSAAELIQLVQVLGDRKVVCYAPYKETRRNLFNVYLPGDDELIIDLTSVSPQDFKTLYDGFEDKSALATPLRLMHKDSLTSYLMDEGVKNLAPLTKDEMIALILKNPRYLYRVLGGTVHGQAYVEQCATSVPLGPKTRLVFNTHPINVGSRRVDFWQVTWREERDGPATDHTIEFSTRSEPSELAGIPAAASVTLSWRMVQAPSLEFTAPTVDLASKRIKEIAEELGVPATTDRLAMLERILTHFKSPEKAAELDGISVYFSFDGPIAVGRPFEARELLALGKFIKVVASAPVFDRRDGNGRIVDRSNLFQCQIDAKTERGDFQHYFKAHPRIWAVLADVSLGEG